MVYSALLLGLLGSLHCVGMCGPIAFLLPVDRSNSVRKLGQTFLYHLGRIMAYATIGLIFGIIGKSFYLFGLQQQLSIVAGILMIVLVILPKSLSTKFKIAQPMYRFIAKIKQQLGLALQKTSSDTFLTIGFLNGFLPCGLVYMAVFGAMASEGLAQSSLYMMLFGLGTIPLMTTAIYLGKVLNSQVRLHLQKAIPILVVVIGVLFILRGLGLGIPYISPAPVVEMASSSINCH